MEDSFSADNQRKCPAVEVAQFPGWLNFQAARKEQKNTSTPQVRKPQISEEDIEYYVDSEGRELAKMCSIKTKKSNFLDKEQQLKSLQAARMNKDSSKLFQGKNMIQNIHISSERCRSAFKNIIFKLIQNSSMAVAAKLLSDECQKASLMSSQHWLR